MANTTLSKVSVNIKLDNGPDDEGRQRTVSVSLGNLSASNFDADKVLAVKNALEPCLDKEVYSVEMIQTSIITAD